jgi:hypothetical protein
MNPFSRPPIRVAATIAIDGEDNSRKFNAAPGLAAVLAGPNGRDDIRELARQEWGICPEADAVAYGCEDQQAVSRTFDRIYCDRPHRAGGGIAGFEVEICPREAMLWLRETCYPLWLELYRLLHPSGTTAGIAVVTATGGVLV